MQWPLNFYVSHDTPNYMEAYMYFPNTAGVPSIRVIDHLKLLNVIYVLHLGYIHVGYIAQYLHGISRDESKSLLNNNNNRFI